MPDDGTWSDRNRPADPDEYPEDKFAHNYELPFPYIPELDGDNEPTTYAEAIGLDDYDLAGDR